jgi:hypothetical protein
MLHRNEMTPNEAVLLHPGVWDGHSAGVGASERYMVFLQGIRGGMAITKAVLGMERSLQQAKRGGFRPGTWKLYRPGEEFSLENHPKETVFFDQSTLLTRGVYGIDPAEFADPFYPMPPDARAESHFVKEKHLLYLREPSPAMRIGKGDDTRSVRATTMETRVGLTDYHTQVGNLAVPQVVHVGEVNHFVMTDGQEMLTRTHNVHVFPRI